jgi:pimeloyl-ACP methyl ester carboxylesterase
MGGSGQWHLQDPLGKTREVITVDLPGFGKNAHLHPIDRIEGFADWVLDHLTQHGIHAFDLMGHSMGGMIVQEMTRRAPGRIRQLILYGTGPVGALPGRFEPIETSKQRARDDGPQASARRISATWFLDREAAPEFEGCAGIAAQSSLAAILAGLDAMKAWSGTDHLGQIAARTLILWGDQDRTYAWPQVERLWHDIPDSRLAVIPDCAHAVHSEAPDLFNMIVARFLTR